MSYLLTVILSILCIITGITEDQYSLLILFIVFAILYLIPTYLIITKPSNNVRSTHAYPLYLTHLGHDIAIIISTILLILLIIILIYPFKPFNTRPTISLSIIILLFTVLSIIFNIKNSIKFRKMNKVTSATIANANNKMKAILVKQFGAVDNILEMVTDQPRPILLPNDENKLLIKVLTCSLSPSDYRMWSGAAKLVKYPPYGFPYVPLGDVCGIVMNVSKNIENKFKTGDYIIATWDEFGIDCLAEYAVINSTFATVIKDFNNSKIDSIQGAAMANTSICAYDCVQLAHNNVQITNENRILVLGGSGGMGTAIIQFIRNIAPNCYIASTSTDKNLLNGNVLKVDRFIDYRNENWWEIEEFKQNSFDKIFDCAEGCNAFYKANENGIVKTNKNNGLFIAIVINNWYIKGDTIWSLFKSFMIPMLTRIIKNKYRANSEAKYVVTFPAVSADKLNNIIQMYENNEFEVILDPESPFQFTLEDVKNAFQKHENRKGHGKIVIKVADN